MQHDRTAGHEERPTLGDIERSKVYTDIDKALHDAVQQRDTALAVTGELAAKAQHLASQLEGAVELSANEAALLEVLVREEVARHKHPPHALIRVRDKLHERAGRV